MAPRTITRDVTMARTCDASPSSLIWLDGAEVDRSIAGGKGAILGRLIALGAPVPKACVLTTAAWHVFSQAAGLPTRLDEIRSDDIHRIRGLINTAPMPLRILDAVAHAYQGFESIPGAHVSLAVRSSATMEDSGALSFAGLHDTILGVRSHAGLEAAIRQCWSSLWSDRAVEYRRAVRLDADEPAIAVVIQQMVQPDVSFVLFTVDPVSLDPGHAAITASWGLGEAVVSGLVTPDHIIVDSESRVVRYVVGSKESMMLEDPPPGEGSRHVAVPRAMQGIRALTDEQVAMIVSIGRGLAAKLGYPADIEGGVAGGQVYLFQARPITTLRETVALRKTPDSLVLTRPEDRRRRVIR